jgi:hypothetical protein
MTEREEPIGMYHFLTAVEEAIKTADPAKREALAQIIDAYHDDFPEEFDWATGERAPALLYNLMMAIDIACRSEEDKRTKSRIIRLVDRKPEGNS